MLEQGISCLPVLANGLLVGIITNTDLHVALAALLRTARLTVPEQSLAAAAASR
jgi:CBS domain-containing protein